jgi:hypothetical protein
VWYQVGSYQLLQQQKKLMANPQCPPSEVGLYSSMFSLAGALASMLRLLQTHGMHCALQKAQEFEEKAQEYDSPRLGLVTFPLAQGEKQARNRVSPRMAAAQAADAGEHQTTTGLSSEAATRG